MRVPMTSTLLALIGACSPAAPTTSEPPALAALTCLVQTGIGPRAVPLRSQQASGLQILREGLAPAPDDYHDQFCNSGPGEGAVVVLETRLADGTLLVALSCAAAEWWERTLVLLHLDIAQERCDVRAASLYWVADVPPLRAWTAVDWGWIRIDDSDLANEGALRLAFEINGALV
jgi:hypothetical protein